MAVWESFLAKMAKGGMTGAQALSSLIEQGFTVEPHRFWAAWGDTLRSDEIRDYVHTTPPDQINVESLYVQIPWEMKHKYEDVYKIEIYDKNTQETRNVYTTFSHESLMSFSDIMGDVSEWATEQGGRYNWEILSISWEIGRERM